MFLRLLTSLVVSLVLSSTVFAANQADAKRGKELYQIRCIACHSANYNGVGPAHKGVFGRHVGRAADYEYSAALQHADVIWNENTLDHWLADPEAMLPGQKMGFSVPDAQDRADLIAYLRTLTNP